MNEFDLIRRYFSRLTAGRPDVVLGVGDDAALLAPPPGELLAVAADTLVERVHFPAGADAAAVGHKALAVNLSDLAAMGARPAAVLLCLTLPRADEDWLAGFARGFGALAARFGVALVGGDTTRGPLAVGVQVIGYLPAGMALQRSGAQPGDLVCVSGTLGDAALALAGPPGCDAASADWLRARLDRPEPRVALGMALRGLATACIDVSDGLAADLGHLLEASGCGALVRARDLPLSPAYRACASVASLDGYRWALSGGDDYELCFTLPERRLAEVQAVCDRAGCACSPIGRVLARPGLYWEGPDGRERPLPAAGYDHFAAGGEGP